VAQSIRDVVEDLYGALTRGDEEWFRQHLVGGPGAVHIGTTESYWQSPDDLIQALRRAFAEVPMDWHPGPDMVIGQRGNVAWVADRPQVRFDDGSDFAPRVTMVFVDEDGTWKLAHSHYSSSSD
jgi:hypothetical protein